MEQFGNSTAEWSYDYNTSYNDHSSNAFSWNPLPIQQQPSNVPPTYPEQYCSYQPFHYQGPNVPSPSNSSYSVSPPMENASYIETKPTPPSQQCTSHETVPDMPQWNGSKYTSFQTFKLIERFNKSKQISPKERKQLADELNLTPLQVRIWFQNRRYRVKKMAKRRNDGPIMNF